MSVSGISSSSSLMQGLEEWASMMQKVQSEFKQVGQDLASGNVTQAESDFTTLSQYFSNLASSSTASTSSDSTTSTDSASLASAFSALGTDLSSGNLSAAQSDYATLQKDLGQTANQAPPPPPPPPPSTNNSKSGDSTLLSTLLQEFSTLGTALSSGDLTSAQTAYTTIQQDLLQLGSNSTSSSSSSYSVSG